VKHVLTTTNEAESVGHTIHYVFEDGSPAADDVLDEVWFTRTVTTDEVTGVVSYGDWLAAGGDTTFAAVDSPVVAGFTPSAASSDEVAGLSADSSDSVQTIVYVADPQTATVTYIDDTTGEQLTVDSVAGVTNGPIDYTTAGRIAAYEDAGYVLVSNGFTDGQEVFDTDGSVDQAYEVHLKHGTGEVTGSASSTRTVSYVDGVSGDPVADPVVQTVSFERTGTRDLVTGEVTWGEWVVVDGSSDTFPGVASPDLSADGYLAPDRDSVAALALTGDDALAHPSYSETVVYAKPAVPSGAEDPAGPADPGEPAAPEGAVEPAAPAAPAGSGEPAASAESDGLVPDAGGALAHTGGDVLALAAGGVGLVLAAAILLALKRRGGEKA
jgi:hypothetical protein